MAKAKVELVEGSSYNGRARSFVPGKPHILTNASEIAHYKGKSGFKVTMLEDGPPAAPEAPAKAVKPKAVETTDEGDDEDNEDEDKDGPPSLSKADLEKMKKEQLVEVATGLGVDFGGPGASKAKIIGAILKFQIAQVDDEDEGDDEEEDD